MAWDDRMLQVMTTGKMQSTKQPKPTSLRLDADLSERIEAFMARHGLSMSDFIKKAATDFLDRYETIPSLDELIAEKRKVLDAKKK